METTSQQPVTTTYQPHVPHYLSVPRAAKLLQGCIGKSILRRLAQTGEIKNCIVIEHGKQKQVGIPINELKDFLLIHDIPITAEFNKVFDKEFYKYIPNPYAN